MFSKTKKVEVLTMRKKNAIKVLANTDDIMLYEAFDEFIAEKEVVNAAPKTIKNYKQSFEYFMDFEFDGEDIAANEIQKIYVQQWVASMIKQKKKATTINHYLRDVRAFLYWCMHEDRQYIQPFKIETVKGQEPLPKTFTDEEIEILCQKPTNIRDFTEWRTWAIVNWIVATGNRAATVCELQLGDIDFNNKQIYIRRTKNKKAQVLPLTLGLENAIKQYIKKCRSNCNDNDWLFPNISNEQLTYTALASAFTLYCNERGVQRHNLHGLRHYFATYWARNGGSGDKLQLALGHSSYDMTKRYMHLVDRDLKDDFDLFNPLDNMKHNATRKQKVKMR